MRVSFEITYDADKLAKQMPKMIRKYFNDSITSLGKGSKNAIKKGNFKPISDFTKFVREEGLSGKTGATTSSKKPLRHSGELFRSIKVNKRDRSLEFNKYGMYHLGMGKGETFDISLDEFIKETGAGKSSKIGEAYRIKANKWTNFIKETYGTDIANKSVDIRDWLQFDGNIKTTLKEFFDSLDKNFERKMSWGFSRL